MTARAPFAVLLALTLACCACGDKRPAEEVGGGGPAETAAGLFALARQPDPDAEALRRLFRIEPDEKHLAALYDALAALRDAGDPVPLRVEPLEGLDRTVVDLSAPLPGGGSATYSVQLSGEGEGPFRITWFQGPGVEWPPRPRPRGEGLVGSPPPGDG